MILYRPARPEDRMFVVATWSSTFKVSHSAGLIHCDDWPKIMHPQIMKLIDRPDAQVIVAYESTDPDFVYGFIAGDVSDRRMPVVFYIYVKAPYRRAGYARGLFAALGVDPSKPFIYTCKTPVVSHLAGKIPMARWNPLVARYPKGHREDRP